MVFTTLCNSSDLKNIICSKKNVIIQFSASWCGPCRAIKPFMEQVGKDNENIEVVYVDVDSHQSLSGEYGVRGVPMFVFYKDGVELDGRVVGADRTGIEGKIKLMKNSN